MIGISGLARSGKDTLSKCLKKIIEKEFECEVEIIHLADKLKSDLDKIISCNFNFQVFTEDNEEKELIRPILVAYGEAMKNKWGQDVWMKKLEKEMISRKNKKFFIISDVRFDFEANYVKDNFDGSVIYISKNGNEMPPNEVEAENDPKVRAVSDIIHHWPKYHPDKMSECDLHAEIIWQMIPINKKEKWKQILN